MVSPWRFQFSTGGRRSRDSGWKSQAKEPIQLDIIIVCRKEGMAESQRPSINQAIESARAKLQRLLAAGFELSRNDRKIVLFGQLLTTLKSLEDVEKLAFRSDIQLDDLTAGRLPAQAARQALLFD